jgi:hypothetical protein
VGVLESSPACIAAVAVTATLGAQNRQFDLLTATIEPAEPRDDGAKARRSSAEILGRPFSEPALLRIAYAYEQATKHRRPPGDDAAPPWRSLLVLNLLPARRNDASCRTDLLRQPRDDLRVHVTSV